LIISFFFQFSPPHPTYNLGFFLMLLFLISKKKNQSYPYDLISFLPHRYKKMVSIITARKSMNTNRIINSFFRWYFRVIFTNRILSIANFLIFTNRKFSSIYTEGIDPSWNRRNLKKPSNTMMCKFLWMILPMKLQLDSNKNGRIVTCHWC